MGKVRSYRSPPYRVANRLKGDRMRFTVGDRRIKQVKSVNDIPHYFQYHLENPGADVLMAAWRRPVQAPAAASSDLLTSPSATPPGIAHTYAEELMDNSERDDIGDADSANDT